jgi:hypothetical protein
MKPNLKMSKCFACAEEIRIREQILKSILERSSEMSVNEPNYLPNHSIKVGTFLHYLGRAISSFD